MNVQSHRTKKSNLDDADNQILNKISSKDANRTNIFSVYEVYWCSKIKNKMTYMRGHQVFYVLSTKVFIEKTHNLKTLLLFKISEQKILFR